MTQTAPEPIKLDTTNLAEDEVSLMIDGHVVVAKKGELIITAAQKAGIFIPRFCYHDRLEPVGMCRMCLVEIEGVRGMPPSCTTPVAQDQVVHFHKDNVEKAQDGVLEFLLINHPLDCPVCDRGGECPLQDQTLAFGPGESRFEEEKRHWEKPIEISDHVLLDRERCIQCSRCTRFADDVAGDPLITFVERGGHTQVNTFPDDEFASYFSGNIVQICPVGALTAKPYRFSSRPWDLESTETTCTACSVGCRGVAQTSRNEMVRFLGVDSEPINQGWLCDKGRYGFDYAQSENRVLSPFIKNENGEKESVNYNEALDQVAQAIRNAKDIFGEQSIAFMGASKGTNEDAYEFARLAKSVIGTNRVDVCENTIPGDIVFSAKRARISDLDKASAIITLACDIKETLPVLYLRVRNAIKDKGVSLVDVNSSATSLTSLAKTHIDLIPGDETAQLRAIEEAISQIKEAKGDSSGKVILIAGDINQAQDTSSFIELVEKLLANEDVYLLPSHSSSNVLGAFEMGFAPSLLPGRVAQESNVVPSWPAGEYSQNNGETTLEILNAAQNGDIKVLFLIGANPFSSIGDKALVENALRCIETVVAVDIFENDTTKFANIFLPTTTFSEKSGTVTNIESRVQRVVQVVAPQGNILDDWKIAALISKRLGSEHFIDSVDDITNEISRVATSFAHLSTNVLSRAKDGAILPIDENKDSLLGNESIQIDTPSWEPIATQAQIHEDPLLELDREVHHPSANIEFNEMITAPFAREKAHNRHLDQYSLRLIFEKQFYKNSTLTKNSDSLNFVSTTHETFTVKVNAKDIDGIIDKDSKTILFKNDRGNVEVPYKIDNNVMRGVVIAKLSNDHPMNKLVDSNFEVTDLRFENSNKEGK